METGLAIRENYSMVMYDIIDSANQVISTINNMPQEICIVADTTALECVTEKANEIVVITKELDEIVVENPITIPTRMEWDSDGLEVFSSTGIERFQQEVASVNEKMNTLIETQSQIAERASSLDILPDAATADIQGMSERLLAIQERIQQIEENPLNMGTDVSNTELERLRAKLNEAVQEQNTLNDAIERMDIEEANGAYLRLSQSVRGTEQFIRDSADEQGVFNQQIQNGSGFASKLMDSVKNVISSYANVEQLGKVLDISSELTQNTAQLDSMNDGVQSTSELVNMVYASAQNARGSFINMTAAVAQFGNNAKDAFSGSEEVVAFSNLVQKQMTLAGLSTEDASSAMSQLSEAMGSGALSGSDLNSIFNQTPNLVQNIADYMGVPLEQIRQMADAGELSADIVKNAVLSASDDINSQFEAMPMTWDQASQSIQNTAIMAFQPILQKINEIANSDAFKSLVAGVMQAISVIAEVMTGIFDMIGQVGAFIVDNWSIISPIIYTVVGALALYGAYLLITKAAEAVGTAIKIAMCIASFAHAAATRTEASATNKATVAQHGLNASFLASPVTWFVIMLIAIVVAIFAVCSAIAKMTGVAGSGFGVMAGGINVVLQFFKNLAFSVANILLGIGMAINACASNLMTAFHNGICHVQSWFYDLLATALEVIEGIAKKLNKLPFVDIDYSGISDAADDYAAKAAEARDDIESYMNIKEQFEIGMGSFDTFEDGWMSKAFNEGADWGDGIADKLSGFSLDDMFSNPENMNPEEYSENLYPEGYGDNSYEGMADNVESIADSTGSISDSLSITEENLKYLRDIAEQESINRFTTAEIKIEQTNNNRISSDMDLDGVVSGLTDAVNEAVVIIAEGVHA